MPSIPSSEKNHYLEELIQIQEAWLQAIWAHQSFRQEAWQALGFGAVEVTFPGWLNRGAGPDFYDARLTLGPDEHHGAVEVHLKASGWYAHEHHRNPAYNAVILHVVLDNDQPHPILREDRRTVPQLVLREFLEAERLAILGEPDELLKAYDYLPGRCGLLAAQLPPAPLQRLIGHAAENRIQQKTEMLLEGWDFANEEQLLFQSIFRALGYSAYAGAFEQLARLYPLVTLQPLLQQTFRAARIPVLARWLGSCGMLEGEPPLIKEPSFRKEYAQWQAEWKRVRHPVRVGEPLKRASRPQNSPERRLLGMFHHLYRLANQGLLKGWLKLLSELYSIATEKALKKAALDLTQELFTTPQWEEWQERFSLSSETMTAATQLVGPERQIVIWANAIIPFFLAYARQHQLVDLEKLLYRLFIVLPPEGSNQHTRFMEKRLLPFPVGGLAMKTLRTHQGLIQIYKDFCHSFYQGCAQCQLPHFLNHLAAESSDLKKQKR